jgi:cytochrome P450
MYSEFEKSCDLFHKLSDHVIAQKQTDLANQNTKKSQNGRNLFETVMRQFTNQVWNMADVRSEIDFMISAGADTTTHSLSFVLVLLAIHPEIQAKVFEEV